MCDFHLSSLFKNNDTMFKTKIPEDEAKKIAKVNPNFDKLVFCGIETSDAQRDPCIQGILDLIQRVHKHLTPIPLDIKKCNRKSKKKK